MVGRATFAACSWILEHCPDDPPVLPRVELRHRQEGLARQRDANPRQAGDGRGDDPARRPAGAPAGRAGDARLSLGRGQRRRLLSGANNNGLHSPNAITAMFIATGQDVANVAEGSAAVVYTEMTPGRRSVPLDHHPVAHRRDARRRHGAGHPARVPRAAGLLRQGEGEQAGGDRGRRGAGRRDVAGRGDLVARMGVGARAVRTQPLSVDGDAAARRSPRFELMVGDGTAGAAAVRALAVNRQLAGLWPAGSSHTPAPRARGRGRRRPASGSSASSPCCSGPSCAATCATPAFAVQLRRRLELLGPTYIKLGQILSLREDILPQADHRRAAAPAQPPAGGAVRRTSASIVERRSRPADRRDVRLAWTKSRSARPRSRRSTAPPPSTATTSSSRWSSRASARRSGRDAQLLRTLARGAAAGLPPLPAAGGSSRSSATTRCARWTSAARRTTPRPSPPTSRDQPDIVFPAIYREYSGRERAHDGVPRRPAPRLAGGPGAAARGARAASWTSAPPPSSG